MQSPYSKLRDARNSKLQQPACRPCSASSLHAGPQEQAAPGAAAAAEVVAEKTSQQAAAGKAEGDGSAGTSPSLQRRSGRVPGTAFLQVLPLNRVVSCQATGCSRQGKLYLQRGYEPVLAWPLCVVARHCLPASQRLLSQPMQLLLALMQQPANPPEALLWPTLCCCPGTKPPCRLSCQIVLTRSAVAGRAIPEAAGQDTQQLA